GQIWEAAEFAGHYQLDNLTVIADVNALGQSQPTMYQHDMEVYEKKFESEGFATEVIDGHDVAAVVAALDRAKAIKGKPQAIVARTVKGHGVSFCAGKEHWHGKVPFADTFACFLSRAYDNVRMAAISRSNINLCGSHCGVSIGEDGPSQ